MVDNRENVISYVRQHGPLLPVQVSKELNTNILFASAILGELVSTNRLKLTTVKSGGSPFYYISGQEIKLQQLSNFLGGKEKEAYDFLKKNEVIRDKSAEPWQRVTLRAIKDYAVPLEVEIQGEIELFWKWYLLSNEFVKEKIEQLIGHREIEPVKEEIHKISESLKEIKNSGENLVVQTKIEQDILRPIRKIKKEINNVFYNKINRFLDGSGIKTIGVNVLKKEKDYLFNVLVPSKIGQLNYLLIARNKKTISDSDLVLAMNEGLVRKLPIIFVTNGNLTKKGETYLKNHIGNLLVFKKL